MLAVVMGGRDWFQASANAVGIPGVAGSDAGRDNPPEPSVDVHLIHYTKDPLTNRVALANRT